MRHTLLGRDVVEDRNIPPGMFYIIGANNVVIAWIDGRLWRYPSKEALYDAVIPGHRLALEEAERIGRFVRDGIAAAFKWYGGRWPYGEPGEVPIYRPDREGQHRFPGAEAAYAGRGFFSSDCANGCGAYLTASSSAPALDRRDPAHTSAWGGDDRGLGTCPNEPANDHAFSYEVKPGERWCLLCGGSDAAAPCLAPGLPKLTGILAEDPTEPDYDLGGEG